MGCVCDIHCVCREMPYESATAARYLTAMGRYPITPAGLRAAVRREDLTPVWITAGGQGLHTESSLREFAAKMRSRQRAGWREPRQQSLPGVAKP